MIELYIENKKIDLTDDLEVNFTYETIDPEKLSSIKNSFSKTVNIPGTPNNNITFGHIFRYDKYIPVAGPINIDNYYDPHKRVNWLINKNGSLINRGYCTLDNIIVKNERDITYQLTLYGGIGEFFYSLAYNEDGSPKTLADMFWNWRPKTTLNGHGDALSPGEESTQTLYKASADIVASSYHSLNPLYTYEGTTDIEKDVVLVPCYTGLYEDFDSKHMLVSTFNQNYASLTPYMTSETISALQESFPDTYTDSDGKIYRTLDKSFSPSGSYRYGLVTFSRDIDPWEAGDLRVNELPVAIRLSKLMHTISQQENNGGYEVIWDDEIKQSLHWLYGWVLLGKLKQDTDYVSPIVISKNTTYDGQTDTLDWNAASGDVVSVADPVEYNLSLNSTNLSNGKYNLTLNVYPACSFETYNNFDWYIERYDLVSSSFHSNVYQPGHGQPPVEMYRVYNTVSVLIHKIYDGSTFIKGIADLFYFTTNENYTFPAKPNGFETTFIKTKLALTYFTGAGESLSEVNVHNCKLNANPEISGRLVSYVCDNETISTNINLELDASNLSITQHQCVVIVERSNTSPAPTCTILGEESFSFGAATQNYETTKSIFGFIVGTNLTKWPYNYNYDSNNFSFSFSLNESMQNGFLNTSSSGFNIMNVDKKTLFANSESPMKYISSYCKLMNYKFICDDTSKKVYIKTLKNYYFDKTISLDNRVDLGRDINIKNVITNYKTLNVGLESADTYPINLFNKISRDKFNTKKYDTGIKYNATDSNILDDLVFKNTLDWQQSSIFYNIYPQIPRPYSTQSISWTLFDPEAASVNEIRKKEIFTVGTPSTTDTMLANVDFLPKIALFDKDNKFVDVESSLIFLNGFVKNYDYVEVPLTEKVLVHPTSTNTSHFISSSGEVATSQYQDIFIYNVQPGTRYFVTASFGSGYASYVANYYNASGTRIGTEYLQTNVNLVDAELTLPSGTTQIRCNFRKADPDNKMRAIYPNYVISPRVTFSNDMYEQYYLNQSRCYMYDFKYNDNFTSWGSYSSEQKGTATSWVLPMFSRDLYNVYVYDIQAWNNTSYKMSSWNFVNQEGLDNRYNLMDTDFIYNPDYNYTKTTMSEDYKSNEYEVSEVPQDDDDYTERIYDKSWKDYLNDLYSRNTRDITAYVDLSGLGDASQIMRNLYSWKSHLWIITKLFNFKISETTHDKFTKVTLHKITNKDTWTN